MAARHAGAASSATRRCIYQRGYQRGLARTNLFHTSPSSSQAGYVDGRNVASNSTVPKVNTIGSRR